METLKDHLKGAQASSPEEATGQGRRRRTRKSKSKKTRKSKKGSKKKATRKH